MINEITESAKAVQEVAKTTRMGIEATEKLGAFVARIMGEPIEAATGILTDRLRHMRAERQLRLADRFEKIIRERNLENNSRVVSPKFALPIIENASLEENDELKDLWANLLASALDSEFDGTLRIAFIDILRQLEVVDVHILNYIYSSYDDYWSNFDESAAIENTSSAQEDLENESGRSTYDWRVFGGDIMDKLRLNHSTYKSSIDNLIRVRCITSFLENKHISTDRPNILDVVDPFRTQSRHEVTLDHGYKALTLTNLGFDFVEACIKPKNL